jgi:hypothetical protein
MEIGKMVTETELKKTQATTELAGREITAISGERQAQIQKEGTIGAAAIRERGETKRAEIQERNQARKDKEYQTKVNAIARAELREFDKANKETIDRANETLALPDNPDSKPAKDLARANKARIEQERREKIATLQATYQESDIGRELERGGDKPAAGEIKIKDPKAAKYLDQYK